MCTKLTHLNSFTTITPISRKTHKLAMTNILKKSRILVSAPYPSHSSSSISKSMQTSQTLTWTNFNRTQATVMRPRTMLTRLLHSLLMIASITELISVTSKSIYHRQLALLKLAIRTSKTILLNITNTFTTQQIKLHLMFLSRNSLCSKLMLKPNSTKPLEEVQKVDNIFDWER